MLVELKARLKVVFLVVPLGLSLDNRKSIKSCQELGTWLIEMAANLDLVFIKSGRAVLQAVTLSTAH